MLFRLVKSKKFLKYLMEDAYQFLFTNILKILHTANNQNLFSVNSCTDETFPTNL